MNYGPEIRHIRQTYNCTCGAASAAMILNMSEHEAIELCKTERDGTYLHNVAKAIRNKGLLAHVITVNQNFKKCWWLEKQKYPVYVAGNFYHKYIHNNNKKLRRHAFVIKDGNIYDPAADQVWPWEAYHHKFDSLVIKKIIIVEEKP